MKYSSYSFTGMEPFSCQYHHGKSAIPIKYNELINLNEPSIDFEPQFLIVHIFSTLYSRANTYVPYFCSLLFCTSNISLYSPL